MNTIPVTLFRDLPVYSGSLPADGIQVVAVENNTNTYRVPLESLTGSMAEVATRVPEAADDDVHGNLAWEDGALYVNTPSGWQKTALYPHDHWDDIGPGTRFLRVDGVMTTLSPAEVQNVFESLGIDNATSTNKGLVYVASSLEDSNLKIATVGLVKECVSSTSERMEELYVDMQDMVEHVDAVKLSVDGSLADVLEAKEDIANARTYVTAAESRIAGLDVRVALNADRAELAAQRAEEAAADFPGFDDVPVADSVKAVKSGGIKEWGDANFLPVAHASDIEDENYTIHVSPEDRERWDSYSEAGISPEERDALDNLVNGDIISGNVRIGVGVGETVLWIRKSGDGTNDLSVTADEVAITAAGGLAVNGSATVTGGVAVTGLLTAGGDPVVTTGDAGLFPASGSAAVDGYATVQDAIDYIDSVRNDIFEKVAERYIPVVTTDFATIGGNNTFTGINTFTLHPVYVESVEASSGIVLQPAGADDPTITLTASSGLVEASILDLAGSATVGGTMAVEGATTIGSALTVGGYTALSDGLEVAEDLNIGGNAIVSGNLFARTGFEVSGDTSLLGGLDISGVTVFRDRIESDVEIGYGPLGNIQAEALLEIGDPRTAGYMDYNGYRLVLNAGERTAAHGQLKLLDGYQTCVVAIGDEVRSISPVPLDSSVQAVYASPAVASSDAAPASNDIEGTYASCLFGPVPDPSACSIHNIAVYWHGDGGPGTSDNLIAGFYKVDTLLDLPSALASDPALSSLLAANPVDPSAGCGTVVQRVSARVCGPLSEGFGISAASPTQPDLIPEVRLSGGYGSQGASCAIGVLAQRVNDTIAILVTAGQTGVFIQNENVTATLYKDGAVLSTVSIPYRATFQEFAERLQSLVSGTDIVVNNVEVTVSGTTSVRTVRCIVGTLGSDGNGYFITVNGPAGSPTYEIKFFAGADAYDPGTGSESESESESESPGPTPEYDPVTPQQIATLVSTIPGYTGTVNSVDANVVDVTATQTGTIGNKPMESYGGLVVQEPLGGGGDDRTVAELVEAINSTDIFDLTARVQTADVIRLTAKQSGEEPNDKPVVTSGCFGSDGTVMGSARRGADGIPGSAYKLWLNGEQVLPGGGGEPFDGHLENDLHIGHEGTAFKIYLNGEEFKGGIDLDPIPVSGSTGTAVSSAGVYDVTFVKAETVPPVVDTLSTSGENEGNPYNTDKYAKIGLYHIRGVTGKLVRVRMKNRSGGNIYNVHLQVSYDETFQDSTTRLSYDKIGATGDHQLEWLEWNFDNPLELTGDKPLYVRWRKPDVTSEQVYTYSRKYGTIAADDDSFTRHEDVVERNVPLCELYVETSPSYDRYVWAGPGLLAHEADTGVHLDSYDRNLVTNLGNGMLWDPDSVGGMGVLYASSQLVGLTINSPLGNDGTRPVQAMIQLYGSAEGSIDMMTCDGNPPGWMDNNPSGTPAYYRFVTTRDLDPASVPALSGRVTALETSKQDKLTAGANITIENNVISASGGSAKVYSKYIVIGVWGQSNAVGYDESVLTKYDIPYDADRVKQYSDSLKPLTFCAENIQNMNIVAPRSGTQSAMASERAADAYSVDGRLSYVMTKGIQLPLANLVCSAIPSDYGVIIVPGAVGGLGIDSFKKGAAKPSSITGYSVDSNVYDAFVGRIRAALALNDDNVFGGIVWCQGEVDCGKPVSGYVASLQSIISDVDSDVRTGNEKKMPKVSDPKGYWFAYSWPDYYVNRDTTNILAAQRELLGDGNYSAVPAGTSCNTSNYTTSIPAAHFAADSFRTVIAPMVFGNMFDAGMFQCTGHDSVQPVWSELLLRKSVLNSLIAKVNELAAMHPGDVEPFSIPIRLQDSIKASDLYASSQMSLSVGDTSITIGNGGGWSLAVLDAHVRHFEATLGATVNNNLAVMVACDGSNNTGCGFFVSGSGVGSYKSAYMTANAAQRGFNATSPGSSYVQHSFAVGDKLVMDINDDDTVTVKLVSGGSEYIVFNQSVSDGVTGRSEFNKPRLGLFGSWASGGSINLTDVKVSTTRLS